MKKYSTVITLIGVLAGIGSGAAYAQSYPAKLVRIVTGSPGSVVDFGARLIAQAIAGPLGQQVIVENRGGNIIALGDAVAKAPADGYTLIYAASDFWFGPLMQDARYDPVNDFSAVTLATRSANIVVVHPSLPVKSVKELISLARARPGQLDYASGPAGGSPHLAGELFKALAGVKIVHVPYRGIAMAITGLAGGEVQLAFPGVSVAMPHVKTGRLRALAVTTPEPSILAPGLPSVAATVPGYESVALNGMFAPARTPDRIINQLNQEIVKALGLREVKEKLLVAGAETVGSSPEQLTATVKSELLRLGKIIKDAGIRAN